MGKKLQFIVFPFLFQIDRSKDKEVRRLFAKSINKKSVIEFNIWVCVLKRLEDYNWHKDAANWGVGLRGLGMKNEDVK